MYISIILSGRQVHPKGRLPHELYPLPTFGTQDVEASVEVDNSWNRALPYLLTTHVPQCGRLRSVGLYADALGGLHDGEIRFYGGLYARRLQRDIRRHTQEVIAQGTSDVRVARIGHGDVERETVVVGQ